MIKMALRLKSCYVVPYCLRNQYAKFKINRTILTCLNQRQTDRQTDRYKKNFAFKKNVIFYLGGGSLVIPIFIKFDLL